MGKVPRNACLDHLIENMEKVGGLDSSDLRQGDVLEITVSDGQVIHMEMVDPASGTVGVWSTGAWIMWVHLTENWGMSLSETGGSFKPHRIAAGFRLSIGPLMTPIVTRIMLNGFDLTAPSGQHNN